MSQWNDKSFYVFGSCLHYVMKRMDESDYVNGVHTITGLGFYMARDLV